MTPTRPGQSYDPEQHSTHPRSLTAQQSVVIGFALLEALGIGWLIAHVLLRDAVR